MKKSIKFKENFLKASNLLLTILLILFYLITILFIVALLWIVFTEILTLLWTEYKEVN